MLYLRKNFLRGFLNLINKKSKFQVELLKLISKYNLNNPETEEKVVNFTESLIDWNKLNSFTFVREWFNNQQRNCEASINVIPLNEVNNGWCIEHDTGNLVHDTGGFFSVIGVDVKTKSREVAGGWKQPIVDQGTKSSIIGVMKKKIDGVWHYLFEAKFEPGNYGKILLSPTLQVTYSNLSQAHNGRKPRFSEYFDGTKNDCDVIYDHWLPEDGGRFYLKRVKCMIVEISESELDLIPENFIWMTLYQIKEMLKEDNLVNPHVRTIISVIK